LSQLIVMTLAFSYGTDRSWGHFHFAQKASRIKLHCFVSGTGWFSGYSFDFHANAFLCLAALIQCASRKQQTFADILHAVTL